MSHPLKVELSDAAFATLQCRARATAKTPAELAAAALEDHFGNLQGTRGNDFPPDDAEKAAARKRFEGHFGAVNLGYPTGAENEAIDADLARAYADRHEEG